MLAREILPLIVEPLEWFMRARVVPMLRSLAESERRQDAEGDDLLDRVTGLLDVGASAHQATITPAAETAVRRGLSKADRANASDIDRQTAAGVESATGRKISASRARAALGVDPVGSEPWLDDVTTMALRESLSKIQGTTAAMYERATKQIAADIRAGLRVEVIADKIASEYGKGGEGLGIARNRALFIARNELGNYTEALTKQRHADLGVEEYTWRTAGDERVRGPGGKYPHAYPSHRARNGKRFRWDSPPNESKTDGHPGRPPLCRCHAEPYFAALAKAAPPPPKRKPTPLRSLERGIPASSLDFLREGMRDLATFRAAFTGLDPTAVALGRVPTANAREPFRPIQITIETARGKPPRYILTDGRHRLEAARAAGATQILAEVRVVPVDGGRVQRRTLAINIPK